MKKQNVRDPCIGIEALSLVMTMAVTNVVKQLALDQGNVNNEQK